MYWEGVSWQINFPITKHPPTGLSTDIFCFPVVVVVGEGEAVTFYEGFKPYSQPGQHIAPIFCEASTTITLLTVSAY